MEEPANLTEFPTSDLNNSQWLLTDDIVGPVVALFGGIEFLLAVTLNLLIVIYTLCKVKTEFKSSSFLLFALSLVNLLMGLLYMPYWIAAEAAEEWIFGSTDAIRNVLCQMHGFVLIFLSAASMHILAVISIDRFLSIVKPHTHKKYMSWKLSLVIVVVLLIINCLVSIAPFYSPLLGQYGWSPRVGACLAIFVGYKLYVILQAFHALIPLSIIIITSVWTFVFTRGFLKETLKIQRAALNTEIYEQQRQIYNVRVLNLIGIFGALLLSNAISWIPYLLISLVGFGVGFNSIPNAGFVAAFFLFYFSNVSNPLVQIYFRKELVRSLKKVFCRCDADKNASSEFNSSRRKYLSWFGSSRITKSEQKVQAVNMDAKNQSSLIYNKNDNQPSGQMFAGNSHDQKKIEIIVNSSVPAAYPVNGFDDHQGVALSTSSPL